MKKYMTLGFSLFFFSNASAQSYHPFPEGAVWTQLVYSSFQNYESEDYYSYFINGDTTINGNTYRKLYVTAAFTTTVYPVTYAGALRQDTAQKKVFFYSPDSSSEAIMYDYDLNIGDKVTYLRPPEFEGSNLFLVEAPTVFAIDSVDFNGIPHKRYLYHFSFVTSPDLYPDALIEGFGNTRGLIYPRPDYPVTGNHDYRNIECLSINGQPVFQPGDKCCTSRDSCLALTGIFSPAPDNDFFVTYSENEILFSIGNVESNGMELVILNVLGQEVMREKFRNTSFVGINKESFTAAPHIAVASKDGKPTRSCIFLVH